MTDRVALSAGYIYNDNPIPSVGTLFNVQAPVITQNTIAVGSTVSLTDGTGQSDGNNLDYGMRILDWKSTV